MLFNPYRDEQLQFIVKHWEAIAASAWHGYITQGRGLILIEDGMSILGSPLPDGASLSRYITLKQADRLGGFNPETNRMVVQYDPKSSVVIVVSHPDGGGRCTSYKFNTLNGWLTPPQSFEANAELLGLIPEA